MRIVQLEIEGVDAHRVDVIHDCCLHGNSDVVLCLGVGLDVELPGLHGDRGNGLHNGGP